jgi:hypothetical protein
MDLSLTYFQQKQEAIIAPNRTISDREKEWRYAHIRFAMHSISELVKTIEYVATHAPANDVSINIAGTIHHTTQATLSSEPSATLGNVRDEHGHLSFANPVFIHILNYLSTGRVEISDLSVETLDTLLSLVREYSIRGMLETCKLAYRIRVGEAASEQWLGRLRTLFPDVLVAYRKGEIIIKETGSFRVRSKDASRLGSTPPECLNHASRQLGQQYGIQSHLGRPPYVKRSQQTLSVFLSIGDDDVWHMLTQNY